jgi:cold shock CspA family protein
MAKSQDSFNKKEKEKKRRKKNEEKLERREQRKADKLEGGTVAFEDMLSYVDENGNFSSTPPDPSKRTVINVEDIILGASSRYVLPEETTRHGRIKFFNDEKGYGFILDAETKDSVFVHINNLNDPVRENDRVTYEVEMGPKGPNAVNVSLEK